MTPSAVAEELGLNLSTGGGTPARVHDVLDGPVGVVATAYLRIGDDALATGSLARRSRRNPRGRLGRGRATGARRAPGARPRALAASSNAEMAAMSASPILRLISTLCTWRTYRLDPGHLAASTVATLRNVPSVPAQRRPPVARRRRPLARARKIAERLADTYPGTARELCALVPSQRLRTARRDDPVGPVHRRAREPRHASADSRYPTPQDLCRSGPRRAGGTDPLHRVLPLQGLSPHRRLRGDRAPSTAARCPDTMEELTALPGVGRKTANVVLSVAFGLPGLPVDTHVIRLSQTPRPHASRPIRSRSSRTLRLCSAIGSGGRSACASFCTAAGFASPAGLAVRSARSLTFVRRDETLSCGAKSDERVTCL